MHYQHHLLHPPIHTERVDFLHMFVDFLTGKVVDGRWFSKYILYLWVNSKILSLVAKKIFKQAWYYFTRLFVSLPWINHPKNTIFGRRNTENTLSWQNTRLKDGVGIIPEWATEIEDGGVQVLQGTQEHQYPTNGDRDWRLRILWLLFPHHRQGIKEYRDCLRSF